MTDTRTITPADIDTLEGVRLSHGSYVDASPQTYR